MWWVILVVVIIMVSSVLNIMKVVGVVVLLNSVEMRFVLSGVLNRLCVSSLLGCLVIFGCRNSVYRMLIMGVCVSMGSIFVNGDVFLLWYSLSIFFCRCLGFFLWWCCSLCSFGVRCVLVCFVLVWEMLIGMSSVCISSVMRMMVRVVVDVLVRGVRRLERLVSVL